MARGLHSSASLTSATPEAPSVDTVEAPARTAAQCVTPKGVPMATTATGPDVGAFSTEREAHPRHLRACTRALEARGWQQRLAPLAQALAGLRLVRGRNEHGAPLRRLDAEVLRETLCRLLSAGDEG
jgi:hypothetical protein